MCRGTTVKVDSAISDRARTSRNPGIHDFPLSIYYLWSYWTKIKTGSFNEPMVKGAIIAVVLAAPMSATAQDVPLTIPRDQAECLSTITDLEAKINTDPVLLRLRTCPEIITGVRDFLESSQNASPGIITPRTGGGVEVLILTKREVVCLIQQIKLAIAAVPETDPVTVDLSLCADQ